MDIERIRSEFPALTRRAAGRPVVYLDNAASTLKVRSAIDVLVKYLETNGANVHRGLHSMSQEASEAFEGTRSLAARFLGASADDEIVFTKNATEGLNLVAAGLGLTADDNVVGTIADHHSNILPWHTRCRFRAADVYENPANPFAGIASLIDGKTRAIVAPLYSNVTGTRFPVEQLAEIAQKRDIPLVIDAAQAAGHVPVSVTDLGADFLAVSAHKMCSPPGVGALYGRREWLGKLAPSVVGGGTIATLDLDDKAVFRHHPWRFEAGTPDIGSVLAFGAAIRFLEDVDLRRAHEHVLKVWRAGLEVVKREKLEDLFDVKHGAEEDNAGILAFAPKRSSADVTRLSQVLSDTYGVMARAGSHCAHPLHKRLGWSHGSLRVSAQMYNTVEEMTYAIESLAKSARTM